MDYKAPDYEQQGRELRREYRWTALTTIGLFAGCFGLFLLALNLATM